MADEELYDGRLIRESKLIWTALYSNLQLRQELVNKIKISEVLLQDQRWMHLDELTEDQVEVFTT